MSSSNNYGVELGMSFVSFDTVNKEYQAILKRLGTSGQIKVNARLEKADLENMIKDFKQVVNQKVTFDTTGAKTEIKTLRNSANELLTIINKFNNNNELLSTSIGGSSRVQLEAKVGIYKQLNDLQKVEFNLKKQMLTAEGGHYNELNRQLQITKQLQSSAGIALKNGNLVDDIETNKLLKERLTLRNNLNAKGSQVNENNNQAQIKAEIKVWEQYETKLKEVNATKLKLTQATNIAKSDGLINKSTANNLLGQIEKINVNTAKSDLDRVTESVNNLGKSGDRILTLTNEIKKYKTEVASLKANSSDALGIGSNVEKLAQYEKSLQEAQRVLNMLKKNSGSVSNASFNSAKLNLGLSANDLKSGVSAVENIQSKLVSLQGTIASMSSNGLYSGDFITTLQNKFNSFNTNTAEKELDEFKSYLGSLSGGNETGIVKLSKDIDGFANKISALKSKYKGLVPDTELAKFDVLLNNLRTKLESMKNGEVIDSKKLAIEINNVKSAYDKLNLSTKNNSMAFKTGNQDVKSFGSALVDTAGKMGIYLSSAIAFRKIFTEFKEAVEYTKTMDKGMTNIQMITGQTASQVSETVGQFKELGAELHVTNTEIIASSEELLRAGYSAEETKKMMSASLIGSKVSGQTAESVTEQLIAMKNAFGLSADSMEHYVDVISKMDNTSATSFAEIANAVQRTAYSAQQSGTELDTLITYITTVSEKTRKPAETIGESFKTIYARYSNIKLGNLDEDGKSINDTEKAMARVGIQIRDSKDSFREFDDVLQEFMTKYKSGQLSQVDYLAGVQALAGTRQRETLMALSENMDTLNKHQEDVASSAGSAKAMLENAYDGSIDAKIQDLQRNFETLYETILNSKTLGTGLDLLSSGVQGISKAFGSLPTVIGLVVAGFTIFNAKFRENSTLYSNMISPINNLNIKLASMSTSLKATALGYSKSLTQLKSYTVAMQGAGMSTSGYSTKLALLNTKLVLARIGMVALKFATIALQTAMSVGLSLVITEVITLVDNLIHKNEKLAESNQKYLESIKTNEEAISSTTKLLAQKKSLEAQMSKSNITEEESLALKTQLVDIEKQIATALPESISGYTLEGEKISSNNDLIQKQIDLKKEQIAMEAKTVLMQNNSPDETDKEKKILEENIKRYNEAKSYNNDKNTPGFKKYATYKRVFDINEDGSFVDNGGNPLSPSSYMTDGNIKKLIEDLKTAEANANSTKQALLSMFNQGYTAKDIVEMKELGWSTEDVSSAMEELGYTKEQISQSSNGVQIALSGENKELEKQNGLLKDNNDAGAKAIDIKKESAKYSDALAQQQKIVDLQNQINESGKITPSIIQSALDLYPEMGSAVFDVATLQEYLNNKVSEQEDKQRQAYVNMMQGDEAFFSSKIKNTSDYEKFTATVLSNLSNLNIQYFENNADGMKTELDNAKNLGQARTAIEAKVVEANMKMWAEYYSKLAFTVNGTKLYNNPYDSYGRVREGTNENGETWASIVEKQSQQLQMINAMRRASDDLGRGIDIKMPTFSSTDFKNSGKGSSSSSTKKEVEDMKDLRDRYYELQNAIDYLSNRYNILISQREGLTGQAYRDSLNEEISLLKQQQQALTNLAEAKRSERYELQGDLGGNWGFSFGSQGEVSNYQTRLKQLTDYANSLTGDAKENYKKALEEVSEKLKNYTDLTIKETEDMNNRWVELGNKIRDAYKTMADDIATEEKNISDVIKYYAEKNTKEKQDAIDRQIEATNKMYDQEDKEVDLSKKKAELAELKSEMDKFQFATDKIGINKFKALQEQYKTLEEEMNNTIRDNQKQATIDAMQKEKDDLSTALEEYLKPENINKLIEAGLKTGMVDIMGQVVDLNNANSQMLKETEIGYTNIASKTKEWKDYLSSIIAMYPQLGNITSNLGYTIDRTAPINLGTGSLNVANLTNSVGSGGINISMPLTINGNVDQNSLNDVKLLINEATNNVKKEINKSLGNR